MQDRPFAKPGGKLLQARAFAGRRAWRQSVRQQGQGLAPLHRVDLLANGVLRQDAVDPGGDQTHAMAPALQEGPQVLLPPGVIDHHQDAAVAKRLAELCRGGVQGLEVRTLARERRDEVGDDRDQLSRLLTQFGPQDSVEIGVLDIGVAGERLGERRLAVAAGAAQRRGDAGDGSAFGVEQTTLSARRIRPDGR